MTTAPPRGGAQTPVISTPNNATAFENDTSNSRTSDELSASTDGHQPSTPKATTESALDKARNERDLTRAAIKTLKGFQLVRQLSQREQDALQEYHETLKELVQLVKTLKSDEKEERGKTAAEDEGKEEEEEDDDEGDEIERGNDADVNEALLPAGDDEPAPSAKGAQPSDPDEETANPTTTKSPAAQKPVSSACVKKYQAKRKWKGHGWAKKKSHRPAWHPDNYNADPDVWYDIRGIIAETKTTYRIEWAGTDSAGGLYVDTSVPKGHANDPAVAEWEKKVREREQDDTLEEEDEGQRKTKKSKKAGGAKKTAKK